MDGVCMLTRRVVKIKLYITKCTQLVKFATFTTDVDLNYECVGHY